MVEPHLQVSFGIYAEVAEQADASVSKTDVRKDVRVRLPLSAPRRIRTVWTPIRLRLNVEAPGAREVALTPRERVRLLASRVGDEAVARWCAELLLATVSYDDPRRPSLAWLGGRHAARLMQRSGFDVHGQDYWPRAWGARGLLHTWWPGSEPAVIHGLRDPAWRVREMCAKVVRHRHIDGAEPILDHLVDDPVARVRVAAEAALTESARSKGSRRPRSSPARPHLP
jgi:hypothetical protein